MKKLFLTVSLLILSSCALADSTWQLNIKHWQTDNHVPVYFVRAPQLPMVDIRLLFRAGSSLDEKQWGIAALTNSLVGQATSNLSSNDIADTFDGVGAQWNTSIDRDVASVSLRSLSNPQALQTALQTFEALLADARFPEKTFTRVKKQTLSAILEDQASVSHVTKNAFYAALYGKAPYGHPVLGEKETVEALSSQDVKHFYKTYYTAGNAKLVMVGDLTLAQAKTIANGITKSLPKGKPIPALQKAMPKQKQTLNIHFPSTQTHILMGQVAISRQNPNYFPLTVGNYILGGGGFASRLFEEIRVKHGFSYSAYSYFMPLLARGPFMIGMQTRTQAAPQALALAEKVLDAFVTQGPTANELQAAKQNLIGRFPIQLDSNKKILANVSNLAFYDLPLNYLETYRQQINNVSLKAIKKSFAHTLHPKNMTVILVGQTNARKKDNG